MKRILVGLTALLLAGRVEAQSAATVGAPLRPGEVALHIVARGETTSRADRITLSVSVNGRGPTLAEARTAADAGVARLISALAAAGVDRAAITTSGNRIGIASPLVMFEPAAPNEGGSHPAPRRATTTLQVIVSDRATLDRATQVIAAQDSASAATPTPTLRDDAPARRTAVAAALDHARRTADDYAAPLGLRVARVAAVSNGAGIADGVEELTEAFSQLQGRDKAPDTVTTRATAVVDFVLAPR